MYNHAYEYVHESHTKYETQKRVRWLRINYPLYRGEGRGIGAAGNFRGVVTDF